VRFPCVHAAATTPVQRMGVLVALTYPFGDGRGMMRLMTELRWR
jgi:hypothetical protein